MSLYQFYSRQLSEIYRIVTTSKQMGLLAARHQFLLCIGSRSVLKARIRPPLSLAPTPDTFAPLATPEVAPLLIRAKGYGGHLLAQGIETPHRFNLIVRWQSLEDHTPGFEASEDHRVFMTGIQEYLSEEPTVYHIEGTVF